MNKQLLRKAEDAAKELLTGDHGPSNEVMRALALITAVLRTEDLSVFTRES